MSGDKDNETQVETILVVDDDSLVRESISLFLDAKRLFCSRGRKRSRSARGVENSASIPVPGYA